MSKLLGDPIRVLFLCTSNSGRSQIAEALLNEMAKSRFLAFSAGVEAKPINPLTMAVLGEVIIDWSGARSKPLTEFLDQPFDYVITLCAPARAACPNFPDQVRRLHWDIVDPSAIEGSEALRLEAFRRARQVLANHLRAFIAEVELRGF